MAARIKPGFSLDLFLSDIVRGSFCSDLPALEASVEEPVIQFLDWDNVTARIYLH